MSKVVLEFETKIKLAVPTVEEIKTYLSLKGWSLSTRESATASCVPYEIPNNTRLLWVPKHENVPFYYAFLTILLKDLLECVDGHFTFPSFVDGIITLNPSI